MTDLDELERLWRDERNRPGGTIARDHVLALIERVRKAEAVIAEAAAKCYEPDATEGDVLRILSGFSASGDSAETADGGAT